MGLLYDAQQTRTNSHDQGVKLRFFAGLLHGQNMTLSRFYQNSSVWVGPGSDWIEVSDNVKDAFSIQHTEHETTLQLQGKALSGVWSDERYFHVKARTGGGGTICNAYDTVVLDEDAPTLYVPMSEPGNTQHDLTSGHHDATNFGATTGSASIVDGDASPTAFFSGGSNYMRVTMSPVNGTQTIEAVVKTTTGGTICEFTDSNAATGGNYDRTLWIDPTTGFARFYVYNGAAVTLSGASNLRDGLTHYIIGQVSATAALTSLYVDGVLVASVANADAYHFSGTAYLRVGNGSHGAFVGNIAKVAYYPTALRIDRVQKHTQSGWVDIFCGYIGQGGTATPTWIAAPITIDGKSEKSYLDRILTPSKKFGPVDLAQGKRVTTSSVLGLPEVDWPYERFEGAQVDGSMAVDDKPVRTTWIAATAPGLDGDYVAPPFNRYYVLNEAASGGAAGPHDEVPIFAEIVPSAACHYTSDGTRNLGNFQAYTTADMPTTKQIQCHPADPGDPHGMTCIHVNGNNWQLANAVNLPFSPYPNNLQVLRSQAVSGQVVPHMLWIMSEHDEQSSQMGVAPNKGWHYKVRCWFKVNLPSDNNRHWVRVGIIGAQYEYMLATGDWQLLEKEMVATIVNNEANPYASFSLFCWTTSDSGGRPDPTITSMDFARVQIIGGAPIHAEYNPATNRGLGDLHLVVRNTNGTVQADINLANYPDTQSIGLKSIITTPSKRVLEQYYLNLSTASVIDISDNYPGVWLDTSGYHGGAGTYTLELYSAAVTQVVRCDPDEQGCVNGQRTITQLPRVNHDHVILDTVTQPADDTYGGYNGKYPTDARYSYKRLSGGLSGKWNPNPFPSPGEALEGSTSEKIMVDLNLFDCATLAQDLTALDGLTFVVMGNAEHVPINGYVRLDAEFFEVSQVIEQTVYCRRRNFALGGQSSTNTVHGAGTLVQPMLPDPLPATTYHGQTLYRVAGVELLRPDGKSVIETADILYTTSDAGLPTDRNDATWKLWCHFTGNTAAQRIFFDADEIFNPPPYPADTTLWADPQLVGKEVRKVCVIIYRMSRRGDNNTRDRAKLSGLRVIEKPMNSGYTGAWQSEYNISTIEQAVFYLWTRFGVDTNHAPEEMAARVLYTPPNGSIGQRVQGTPFDNLSVAETAYSDAFTQLLSKAGMDWAINASGQLEVYPNRHLGYSVGFGTQFQFGRDNTTTMQVVIEPKNPVCQIKLSGSDRNDKYYLSVYPAVPTRRGKIAQQTNMTVISQEALDRMAETQYNYLNRGYTVSLQTGLCEWLKRGMLVSVNWGIGPNGEAPFNGSVFVVAGWVQTFSIQRTGYWSCITSIQLEERRLS